MKPVAGSATQLRVAGRSWRGAASEGLMPGAQGELQRNGKPLALAGRPGRRRKTKTISSSGGAVAQPARRRRSNGGHDRPGSSGMKPVAGSATQLRVAGRSWRGAASEGLMPGAQGEPQRNGKLFVLPVKAGRGRSRGRKSSAGAAGAQAVALEEARNRAPACGRAVLEG